MNSEDRALQKALYRSHRDQGKKYNLKRILNDSFEEYLIKKAEEESYEDYQYQLAKEESLTTLSISDFEYMTGIKGIVGPTSVESSISQVEAHDYRDTILFGVLFVVLSFFIAKKSLLLF